MVVEGNSHGLSSGGASYSELPIRELATMPRRRHMVKQVRCVAFVLMTVICLVVASEEVRADYCEEPGGYTGSGATPEAAMADCENNENGWMDGCSAACDDGGSTWHGELTEGSCSSAGVCGYVGGNPVYCSSAILACYREEY